MSEVNKGNAEYGDIPQLAARVCERAKDVIDTDAERWMVDWDTALRPAADDDEAYYRSIAHSQMSKLLELTVRQKYVELMKEYTVQAVIEALVVTDTMPTVDGRATRVEATYDDVDVTYVHTAIDAGAMGKCQAAMVNITRDAQVKKYLVAVLPNGDAYTHTGTEIIDLYLNDSALDALPVSQIGNIATILSAGALPEQVEGIIAEIKAASHAVDPALLAEATTMLRELYAQKHATREFEQSLGGYTDMTAQDFADMQAMLDKRVQQRGY